MINQLGGLAADVDDRWLIAETELMIMVADAAEVAGELLDAPEPAAAAARIPPLTSRLVRDYGVSGPAARAAGVDLDLRRSAPYLCYPELAAVLSDRPRSPHPVGSAGARLAIMIDELRSSTTMITTIIDRVAGMPGPVNVRLGKIVKLPEAEIYLATEAPLGQSGCYLVSRGEKTPWRLKLRTPSFNNVAVLEALLPGCPVADLELALASVGYVVGDIDK